jgi:hypothetical protein
MFWDFNWQPGTGHWLLNFKVYRQPLGMARSQNRFSLIAMASIARRLHLIAKIEIREFLISNKELN